MGAVWPGVGVAAGQHGRRGRQARPARHAAEIAAHETFNYAVLDEAETELLGCIYIDPPDDASPSGSDAVASW